MMQITDAQRKAMREAIREYFEEERDESIGIIQQDGILALFMEQLAPIVYDKALDDAKAWFTRRLQELENDYYLMYKT